MTEWFFVDCHIYFLLWIKRRLIYVVSNEHYKVIYITRGPFFEEKTIKLIIRYFSLTKSFKTLAFEITSSTEMS
jgi:hypothetical protein